VARASACDRLAVATWLIPAGDHSSNAEAETFRAFAMRSSTMMVGLRTPRSTPDT
jgi:hypothetical protein